MTNDEHSMSLWQIDATIAQLLEMREDLLAHPETNSAEWEQGVAAVTSELQRYVTEQLPAKVDSYIGLIRRDEAVAAAAEAEAERYAAIAKARRARVKYLKDTALAVMQASGKKRLEGRAGGALRLQANGGAQPVEITEPSLVPDEMCDVTVTIAAQCWTRWVQVLRANQWTIEPYLKRGPDRTPRLKDIAAELARKCDKCEGHGLLENGDDCPECGGDGQRRVPGAHLAARGEHVRIV
jgi:hypothetical protein